MKKIMVVFGTRPEAIKMAPLVKSIEKDARFEVSVVVTGQHREMLDQVLEVFEVTPDYDLDIMGLNQTLDEITTKVISKTSRVLDQEKPDIVLVHGDTATTLGAAIAAFYKKIPVGHVEAGLRTWDKYSPFPEEINRQLTDVLSDLYFAPTQDSKDNLLQEHHAAEHIYITGNTAIDAMKYTIPSIIKNKTDNKQILLTMHRRENIGEPMINVFHAIARICVAFPEYQVVYPMHKNPKVREIARDIFGDIRNIKLVEPLDVVSFHKAENESYMILTDSGGVQEEAPSLGVPVLVLRDTTERPEGVAAGTLKLVGTNEEDVYQHIYDLITCPETYQAMSQAANPYGDGFASEKILDAIATYFSI